MSDVQCRISEGTYKLPQKTEVFSKTHFSMIFLAISWRLVAISTMTGLFETMIGQELTTEALDIMRRQLLDQCEWMNEWCEWMCKWMKSLVPISVRTSSFDFTVLKELQSTLTESWSIVRSWQKQNLLVHATEWFDLTILGQSRNTWNKTALITTVCIS